MPKYTKDKNGRYVLDKRIAGKRCHIFGKTCAEVDKKLAAWLAKQADEEAKKEQGPLFEVIAQEWYNKITAEQSVAYSTAAMYRIRLNSAIEEFSGYRMTQITSLDITQFYDKMAAKGYSKKTITHERTVLRNIYAYWNLEYNANYSPMNFAKIAKGKESAGREPPPEAAVVAVKANPAGFGVLPMLLMYTGLRLSEALGIQVKDINMTSPIYGCPGQINIAKEVKWYSGGVPYIKEPKTKAGIRVVPIMSKLYPVLQQAISGLQPDDYLISRCPDPLTGSAYNRRWASYCRSIGFAEMRKIPAKRRGKPYMITEWKPTITAHQFRHLMATACYEANVPELVAQKILGHKSISTTHKVYTHIRDSMLAQSYQALDTLERNI